MKKSTFRESLEKAQGELFRHAFRFTSNKEDAEDLLQETCLKALINEDKYIPDTNFNAWIYTIMRNIFINDYRKLHRRKISVESIDLHCLSEPTDAPDARVKVKEMVHLINTLPVKHKKALQLYIVGFKYEEIAGKLNMPLGSVKSNVFFARQRLSNII
ncbi:ECF RNA polymerase sigma factor EcfG [termite gut metagenome]|uniref:ECF RNA polymerase sigma factor EcfG n=1 Tax=termite gut metagenome TaxID=433724 RepID=A0A5J4SQ11_9ZZZZ